MNPKAAFNVILICWIQWELQRTLVGDRNSTVQYLDPKNAKIHQIQHQHLPGGLWRTWPGVSSSLWDWSNKRGQLSFQEISHTYPVPYIVDKKRIVDPYLGRFWGAQKLGKGLSTGCLFTHIVSKFTHSQKFASSEIGVSFSGELFPVRQ